MAALQRQYLALLEVIDRKLEPSIRSSVQILVIAVIEPGNRCSSRQPQRPTAARAHADEDLGVEHDRRRERLSTKEVERPFHA